MTQHADTIYSHGADEILVLIANDPFVANAWDEQLGISKAAIRVLCDPLGHYAKIMGMKFDAPSAGLFNRYKRFALVACDSKIIALEVEYNVGNCTLTHGDSIVNMVSTLDHNP